MVVDPACGMEVDPDNPGATIEYDGAVYYFCSEGCKDHFEKNPDRYVTSHGPHLSALGGMTTPRIIPHGEAKGEFDLSVAGDSLDVGDSVTYTRTLTEEDLRAFAQATGDTNALHLNDEFAERTRFGRRIVHGTLVSGLISAALASLPGLTIYVSQNLEFNRPVDVGETLTATCTIAERLDEDKYRLTTRIEDEDGETVIDGTATVLIDDLPSEYQ